MKRKAALAAICRLNTLPEEDSDCGEDNSESDCDENLDRISDAESRECEVLK